MGNSLQITDLTKSAICNLKSEILLLPSSLLLLRQGYGKGCTLIEDAVNPDVTVVIFDNRLRDR